MRLFVAVAGAVGVVVVAVLLALFAWHDYKHDVNSFECITSGAHMHWKNDAGDLHTTIWCTKDGVTVP